MPAIRKRPTSTKDKDKLAARTCAVCSKVLGRPGDVQRHIDTAHNGTKNFACDYCEKRFAQKTGRDIHHHTHTGAKPYPCGLCGVGFGDPSCRKRHRKVQHANDMTEFGCPKCSKSFEGFDPLTKHLDTQHKPSPSTNITRSSWIKRRKSSSLDRKRSSFSGSLGISHLTNRRESLARRCKAPTNLFPVIGEDSTATSIDNHTSSSSSHLVASRTTASSIPPLFISNSYQRPMLQIDPFGTSAVRVRVDMVLESPRGTRFDQTTQYNPSRFPTPPPSAPDPTSREYGRTPEPVTHSEPEFVPASSTVLIPSQTSAPLVLTPPSFPSLGTWDAAEAGIAEPSAIAPTPLCSSSAIIPSPPKRESFSWITDMSISTTQPFCSSHTNACSPYYPTYFESKSDLSSSNAHADGMYGFDFFVRDARRVSFGLEGNGYDTFHMF